MKHILDSLWQDYLLEKHSEMYDEERKALRSVISIEEKLRKELTNGQLQSIETLKEAIYEMSAQSERKAFRLGVSFATKYLIDIFTSESGAEN